jgi:hypothetical protein
MNNIGMEALDEYDPSKEWIGVDLDRTLAHYEKWVDIYTIGEPIPKMVRRIKHWIREGKTVKIFTARASQEPIEDISKAIGDWTEKHMGTRLEVTCRKDMYMTQLWDDIAVRVEVNTGEIDNSFKEEDSSEKPSKSYSFIGENVFIIDVESIGIHGEPFSVAGGIYNIKTNKEIESFVFGIPRNIANGLPSDRKWVDENIPEFDYTKSFESVDEMCQAFMEKWIAIKKQYDGINMFAECPWPVEGRFLNTCVKTDISKYIFEGPYPLYDITSMMAIAGLDPMATYKRIESEKPAHNPLSDIRLSFRLLCHSVK